MDNVEKIWAEYAKNNDPSLKEKLIIHYAQLVKYVAGRLNMQLGSYVDFDDLVGYGVFGLIDAIDKFDINKGVKFETYASLRIRGSILDSIRKQDWIPRTIRQQNKVLESAYETLELKFGREPNEIELSDELGLSIDETKKLIRKSAVASVISLEDYTLQNNKQVTYENQKMAMSPEIEYDKKEAKEDLMKALKTLSEREIYIINLYYYEELTLKEISNVLDISEARVSQIHSKVIKKLGEKLQNNGIILNEF